MDREKITFDLIGVGSRLKAVRKKLNLKQQELAEILSITVVTLSDIERGKKKPGIDVIFILSKSLRVNPLYLLHGEGDMFCQDNDLKGIVVADGIFGDYTDDIREMLWFMQNSRLARSAVITMAKEYFYKYDKLLQRDINKQKLKDEKNPS